MTNSLIKLSVVIPLYNKEDYIHRAVSSVLKQNVSDYEIIVVDDGSSDDGRSIVEAISDRRIKVISQENHGVSAARNRGVEAASSDLIAFLDADDEWKPGFLEMILSLRERFPNAGAYGTSYETLVRGGKTYYPVYKGVPEGWEGILPSYFRASLGMNVLIASAVAIPKHVLKEVGEFQVGEKLGEDLDMWLRIALRYPIAYSNCRLAVYHHDAVNRTDGLTISVCNLIYLKNAELALQSGAVPDHLHNDLIDYVALRKIGYAELFIKLGQPAKGRRVLAKVNNKRFAHEKRLWILFSYIPSIVFDMLRFVKWRFYSFWLSLKRHIHW